jgi:hypothetical protein
VRAAIDIAADSAIIMHDKAMKKGVANLKHEVARRIGRDQVERAKLHACGRSEDALLRRGVVHELT